MTETARSVSPADTAQRRSRTQVWILISVFFGPLLVAFALYYGAPMLGFDWRPQGSTNRGDLIHPARPLPAVELATLEGAPVTPETLRGKWNVFYIGDGQCDARCREALILMRQTRLALNDDMTRVQRIFLTTGNCCDEQYLAAEHPGLVVAKADDAAGQQLISAFPVADQGRIYIVDPLGNLMMSYAPDAPRKGLLEDLKKLLKLSHIG